MTERTLPVPWPTRLTSIVPGVSLAALVAITAVGLAAVERWVSGQLVIDALVIAIIIGMVVRTAWKLPARVEVGVRFAAKEILEVAIFLLGISVDLPMLLRAGPGLAVGIILLVIVGLAASLAIGKAIGLPTKLAILVACGNSICGNSAIAAVAPVIRADREHVASAITFTAILGVAVVLGLPLLIQPLALSDYQYGVLAGLTVYAVPQVLAAAFPVSVLSGQVGTLVKLVRVLMLGPVVLFFALRYRQARTAGDAPVFRLTRFVPWFIIGFLTLAVLRSFGLVPESVVTPARTVSSWLTILAMAALGLGVDLSEIRRVGRPVMMTVIASLIVLIVLAVTLIRMLGID